MDLKIIIKEINSRISFKEYIEIYIQDVPRDRKIFCPFHEDKTPSFRVNNEYGYCFSCQKYADIVGFVQASDGLSINKAVYSVAEQLGINIDNLKDNNIGYSPYKVVTGIVLKKDGEGKNVNAERYKIFRTLMDSKALEKELLLKDIDNKFGTNVVSKELGIKINHISKEYDKDFVETQNKKEIEL